MKKRTANDPPAEGNTLNGEVADKTISVDDGMENLPFKIKPLNAYDFSEDSSLAHEINEVINTIHDKCTALPSTDESIALVKLVRNMPLEIWTKYSMYHNLDDWLAIPIKGNASQTLEALIDFQGTLSKQRYTDPMTGIGNRGYFNHCLQQEFTRSLRSGDDLALIIFDLDNFKNVNDTYGHACGDMVLIEFAKMLTSSTRPYDYVARIGGEEFAVILPNTGVFTGNALGNRIRKKLHKMVFKWEGDEFSMTVSGGVSSINTLKDTTTNALFQDADAALYQAKDKGRDRIIISHSTRQTHDSPTLVHADEKRFLFNI